MSIFQSSKPKWMFWSPSSGLVGGAIFGLVLAVVWAIVAEVVRMIGT